MIRYYSHYTFIYPDIYLKNSIVELDDIGKITYVYPYQREIERTEFYSGLLLFVPSDVDVNLDFVDKVKKNGTFSNQYTIPLPYYICKVFTEDLFNLRTRLDI